MSNRNRMHLCALLAAAHLAGAAGCMSQPPTETGHQGGSGGSAATQSDDPLSPIGGVTSPEAVLDPGHAGGELVCAGRKVQGADHVMLVSVEPSSTPMNQMKSKKYQIRSGVTGATGSSQ